VGWETDLSCNSPLDVVDAIEIGKRGKCRRVLEEEIVDIQVIMIAIVTITRHPGTNPIVSSTSGYHQPAIGCRWEGRTRPRTPSPICALISSTEARILVTY